MSAQSGREGSSGHEERRTGQRSGDRRGWRMENGTELWLKKLWLCVCWGRQTQAGSWKKTGRSVLGAAFTGQCGLTQNSFKKNFFFFHGANKRQLVCHKHFRKLKRKRKKEWGRSRGEDRFTRKIQAYDHLFLIQVGPSSAKDAWEILLVRRWKL